MADIINFELTEEQLSKIRELESNEDYMDLKLVSGSDIVACPYCRSNGCYGSCQMSGCFDPD